MKNTRRQFLLLAIWFLSIPSLISQVSFIFPSVTVEQGQLFDVQLKVASFNKIVGTQFTIDWDPEIIEFINIQDFNLPDLSEASFGKVQAGKLTFSWFDNTLNGVNLPDSSIVFSISFEALANPVSSTNIFFNDDPTVREISDTSFTAIQANFVDGEVIIDEVSSTFFNTDLQKTNIEKAFPNPFKEQTAINFFLEKDLELSISIFDAKGREVYADIKTFKRGENSLVLDKKMFSGSGTYLLKMHSDLFTNSQKLILHK